MAKVLLADDSVTIHKVVEIILTSRGVDLISVDNGADALDTVASFMPDVVLADVEMPKLNGYELSSKLKENPATSSIPVVLLAGAFENVDKDLVESSGIASILTKPFEAEDLMDKINSLISDKPAEAEAEDEAEGEAVEAEALEPVGEAHEALAVEAEALEPVGEVHEALAAEDLGPAIEGEGAQELTRLDEGGMEMAGEAQELTAVEDAQAQAEEAEPTASADTEDIKTAAAVAVKASLEGIDLKAVLIEAITPALSDAIEKVLWEIAPELTERLIRDAIKDSMASLSKELETVIWETVPELAESIIKEEIKGIRQET